MEKIVLDLTVDKAWTNHGKTYLERGKTHQSVERLI
jgi:hypothetical protein